MFRISTWYSIYPKFWTDYFTYWLFQLQKLKKCRYDYDAREECKKFCYDLNFIDFNFLSRCESVLNKFLRSIKQDPSRVSFEEMANTVTVHAQSHDNSLQVIDNFKCMDGIFPTSTLKKVSSFLWCELFPQGHYWFPQKLLKNCKKSWHPNIQLVEIN